VINEIFKLIILDPKSSDLIVGRIMKSEPVSVVKAWENLRLGVKDQSNLIIAGSSRNLFE
jgi:hypothetical protein